MNFKTIFKSSLIVLIIKTLSAIASLILGGVLAVKFNAVVVGEFYLFISLLLIFSTIVRFGSMNYILKNLSGEHEDKFYSNAFYYFSLLNSLLLTAFIYCIYLVLSEFGIFKNNGYLSIITYSFLAIPIHSCTFIASSFLQARFRVNQAMVLQNFPAYFVTVLYVFIFEPSNLDEVLVVLISGYLGTFLLSNALLRIYKIIDFTRPLRPNFNLYKEMFHFCKVDLLVVITNWLPVLLSSYFLTKSESGVFALAAKLCWVMSFLLISVNSVFAPKFSSFFRSGAIEQIRELFRKITILLIILTLPVLLFMPFWVPIVTTYLGQEFTANNFTFYICLFGQFIVVAVGPVYYLSLMSDRGHVVSVSMIMSLLLFTPVMALLAFHFGIDGLAIGSSLLFISSRLVLSFDLFKNYRIFSFLKL